METFTHLFEQSVPGGYPSRDFGGDRSADATLRVQLAKLLRTTEEHLPARLKKVGQELAFHLATDPTLYSGFEESLSAAPLAEGLPERGVGDSVEQVRAGLLSKGVSAALRKKVGGA
jgi:thermitase